MSSAKPACFAVSYTRLISPIRKRMKCDDIRDLETGQQSCKSCRDLGLTCAFNAPVRKRCASTDGGACKRANGDDDSGPAVGFKKRRRTSQSADQSRETEISPVIKVNDISVTQPGSSPTKAPVASGSRPPSPGSSNHRSRSASRAPISRDGPFLGLPRPMIDELLAVYFTHVHVGGFSLQSPVVKGPRVADESRTSGL